MITIHQKDIKSKEYFALIETAKKEQSPMSWTAGAVALLFGLAPRTIAKYVDNGKLDGYRIPDGDRRVWHHSVIEMAKRFGLNINIHGYTPQMKVAIVGFDKSVTSQLPVEYMESAVKFTNGYEAIAWLAMNPCSKMVVSAKSVDNHQGFCSAAKGASKNTKLMAVLDADDERYHSASAIYDVVEFMPNAIAKIAEFIA